MQDLPEQSALDEAQADADAARRARLERMRRGTMWYMAVLLIALLIGVMIGRVVNGQIPWSGQWPQTPGQITNTQLLRVLEVQAQEQDGVLWLRLIMEQKLPYRRIEEDAAVSFELPALQLQGALQSGRMQLEGRSLSWRVQQQGADEVQVLLVGLGAAVEVEESWQALEQGWELLFKIELSEPPEPVAGVSLNHLPVAQEAKVDEGVIAARWASLQNIEQALQEEHFEQAFAEWEALQPLVDIEVEPELLQRLAAAYLGQGREVQLLSWLPAQLALQSGDYQLRQLQAQALLQAQDLPAAIAVLAKEPPSLTQAPAYHALWAQLYQRNGQWQESIELYQQMVELRPLQASWQLALAQAFDQLKQNEAALKHYRLALAAEGLDVRERQRIRLRMGQLRK